MSRVRKLRAWAKEAKVMHPVWMKLDDEGGIYEISEFIGLLDRNGKEIFEGDIVINHSDGEYSFVVEWGELGCDYHGGIGYAMGSENPSKCDIEIIGNIYQNPELIKS